LRPLRLEFPLVLQGGEALGLAVGEIAFLLLQLGNLGQRGLPAGLGVLHFFVAQFRLAAGVRLRGGFLLQETGPRVGEALELLFGGATGGIGGGLLGLQPGPFARGVRGVLLRLEFGEAPGLGLLPGEAT